MKFDDFSLDPDQMLTASVRMFIDCGLIEEFNIDYQVHSIYIYTLYRYAESYWKHDDEE
jgi:dual 3',5'-cyclic-AMP and -GMP phosphodiesterase 11